MTVANLWKEYIQQKKARLINSQITCSMLSYTHIYEDPIKFEVHLHFWPICPTMRHARISNAYVTKMKYCK